MPPPKIVVEVLWTCGVVCRVLFELDDAPPFRIVVPRSQPPTLERLDIAGGFKPSISGAR